MTLKKSTSLAIVALAVSVWMGCSSKEDKEKYDHFYGSGSKSREETALVNIQNEKKNAKPAAAASTAGTAASGTAADTASSGAADGTEQADGAAPVAAAKPQRKAVPAEVSTLLNKHACFACHQAYDKVIGPAYAEVAKKKYSADEIVALVHSPKPEHWPGYPPMAPMAHVPKGDIVIIANWINSL
jgi:cytochrome c551/c552